MDKNSFKRFENIKLVQNPAMMKQDGAAKPGTNRSGTKRKHVSDSESGGSTADSMGTGSNSMDRPPDQQQAGSVNLCSQSGGSEPNPKFK